MFATGWPPGRSRTSLLGSAAQLRIRPSGSWTRPNHRHEDGAPFGDAPLWVQAAAAMLVVAASLGVANINLTYTRDGLSIRTGWLPAPQVVAPQAAAAPGRR